MQDKAIIVQGKLAIVTDGGSVCPLGVREFRKQIAQIEASPREITPATAERLRVLKDGVALWQARNAR